MRFARLRHPALEPDIAPLQAPAGSLLLGSQSLRALQDEAARGAGLEPYDWHLGDDAFGSGVDVPADVAVIVAPDVFCSAAALLALRSSPAPAQAAVAAGTALHDASARLTPSFRAAAPLALDLWAGARRLRLEPTNTPNTARVVVEGAALAVVCDEDGAALTSVRPFGPPPHALRVARVQKLGGHVRHWLHALDGALAAAETERLARGAVGGKTVRGGDVDIHPTAYVEDSILGAGVKLEPHVSVIRSVIGDGVLLADHSVVVDSVIGAGCRTLVDTHLRRCVAQAGSTLSNLDMQDALFGAEVFVTTGVAFFGLRPGHDVIVDGVDSGRAVLGGAIGKKAILGSRALLQVGLAVPAGALVVMRPEEGLQKIDAQGLGRAAMRLGDRDVDV